jgi:predicted DNA-binding transcriptional regulator AlpA
MPFNTRPEPTVPPGTESVRTVVLNPLLLTARQAAALCSISPATWHRWTAAGRTPAPIRPSPGCVRWRTEELREWIQADCPDRRTWQAMHEPAQHNGRD